MTRATRLHKNLGLLHTHGAAVSPVYGPLLPRWAGAETLALSKVVEIVQGLK